MNAGTGSHAAVPGRSPALDEAQACGTSPVAVVGGGNSAGQAALAPAGRDERDTRAVR